MKLRLKPRTPWFVVLTTMVTALGFAGAAPAWALGSLVNEPFTGTSATANAWQYGDDACLTAGNGTTPGTSIPSCASVLPSPAPSDPSGSGALLLTTNVFAQKGFVVYKTPLASSSGLQVVFDYYSFNDGGSLGADGLSFFFLDGSAAIPTQSGSPGGGLGYLGITGAYLGVGFDEFGDWSKPSPGFVNNTIALRGSNASGNTYVVGYQNPPGTAASLPFSLDSPSLTRPAGLLVRVTLTPSLYVSVDVDRHDGSGFVNYIPPFNAATVPGQGAFPSSFRFGFAAGTGADYNFHELTNLTVDTAPPEYAISMTDSGNFVQGRNSSYTISVTNVGGTPTTPFPRVVDTLPAGVSYVSASGTNWSCSALGQVVTCNYVSFNPVPAGGTAAPLTLNVASANNAAASVINNATASGGGAQLTASASDTTSIAPASVVGITLSASPTTFTVGQNATYTLTPRSSSTATAGTITVTDVVPTGLSYVSATGTGWACGASGQTVTCTSSSVIGAGTSGVPTSGNPITLITSVGAAALPGPVVNSATIYGGSDVVHTNAGNAASSGNQSNNVTVNMSLTASNPAQNVTVGAAATQTYILTNTSPVAGTFAPTAATVTGPGGAITPGGYVFNGNTYATLAALRTAIASAGTTPANGTIQVGVAYAVPPNAANAATISGTLTATISAFGSTSAPAQGNATDTVQAPILGITTQQSASSLVVGQNGTYTLVPSNGGTAATSGQVTVTDTLPTGLTYVSAGGTGWSCSAVGQSVTCTSTQVIPANSAGNPITLTFSVGAAAVPGPAVDTSAIYGGADPQHTNPATQATSSPQSTPVSVNPTFTINGGTQNVTVGGLATDAFTLTNTTLVAGTFNVLAPVVGDSAGAIAVSGYTFGGVTYATLAALQTAIAAAGPTASGASINVGVQYTVPPSTPNATTITDVFSATFTSGGTTSASQSATASDLVQAPILGIRVSHSGTFAISGTGAYTITLTNTGPAATQAGAVVNDSLPTGFTVGSGFAAPSGWNCTAAVGGTALTCTSTTASLAALTGTQTFTLPVQIGSGSATGTNAVTNIASGYGGGDPAHSTLASAASASDPTTVYAAPGLPIVASGQTVAPSQNVTDTFTLTNAGPQPESVVLQAPSIQAGSSAVPITGYTLGGNAYPTLSALQAALNSAGSIAPGAAIAVGVQYTVPAAAANGSTVATTFSATATAPGNASVTSSATSTDTLYIVPQLTNVTVDWTTGALGTPGTTLTGASSTAGFVLTNTGIAGGTFSLVAAPVPQGPMGPIVPSGYALDASNSNAQAGAHAPASSATTYPTFAALATALATITVAPGGSIAVGVTYGVPAGLAPGKTILTALSAQLSIPNVGGGAPAVSPVVTASVTDSLRGALLITKRANTTIAQIGDPVSYEVDVTNASAQPALNATVSDILPPGMTWIANSLVATINNQPVTVTEKQYGRTVLITLPGPLGPGATLRLVYALTVGPGAIKTESKAHLLNKAHLLAVQTNVASVVGQVSGTSLAGGPATATVFIQPGSTLDSCGTIVGRVFVDKRGDGRQEPGDAPVAHAVIVLDDGTRIQTDQNGMFHVECTRPGWRTGTLDLASAPGFDIPANSVRLDRRSATVSVRLEPNGMVRMNFAVIPKVK